jgi:hypothetical protein
LIELQFSLTAFPEFVFPLVRHSGGYYFSSEGDTPRHTPGPAPKTDVELGLAGSGFVTAHKTQAHMQVIKGDTQKADSAAVPDHLWVHALIYGSFSLKEYVGFRVHKAERDGGFILPSFTSRERG